MSRSTTSRASGFMTSATRISPTSTPSYAAQTSVPVPSGDLKKLPEVFELSEKTMRVVNQNLRWALVYNALSIPIAAAGVLHPSICATSMSLSSIGVLLNSLKLQNGRKEKRWKKKR